MFGQAHRDVTAVRAASLALRVRRDLCRSLISPAHELAIAALEARRFLGDAQHAGHPVIARGKCGRGIHDLRIRSVGGKARALDQSFDFSQGEGI